MIDSEALDVLSLPLDRKVLIEASAGTGKTFTIGLIVIRLLLKDDNPLSIDKIVLITFTNAATHELRQKTTAKLNDAYKMWESEEYLENDDLSVIINKAKKSKDCLKKRANLMEALARIDEMPIYTIHAFCSRLQNEFIFETKNFNKKEHVKDISYIEDRVVADFWRKEANNLGDAEIESLPRKFSPDALYIGLNRVKNFPHAVINYDKKESGKEDPGHIAIAKLQHKLAREFNKSMETQKEKFKKMTDNDLITNIYNAVEQDTKKVLFNAVQKRYDAVLIDEFQDTDKMQYTIFNYLFKNKAFFMIGDPKQAIYRFRGGDIYAYLDAKSELDEIPKTMDKNFRSHERLVSALNAVYKIEKPFENPKICYIPVSHGKELLPLKIENEEQKPFVLMNFEYTNKDKFNGIIKNIIDEISCLLYGLNVEIYDDNTKEYREIKAKDIAILTRTNEQAMEYKNALKESKDRIPAVIRRSGSVLKSEAAFYLNRLLNAFADSSNESGIRAAMLDLKELSLQDIKPFADAYENWINKGIMAAINRYFEENKIWGRLHSEENGERNATNLRQLIEILNNEEAETGRNPERLLKRFSEIIESGAGEENEEMLETDEDAVQIITIHSSKGLQFPVVFVPDITFSNEPTSNARYERQPPLYHEKNKIILEYEVSNRTEKEGNAKAKEIAESIEESARQFYVAITRPIYRLYVVNAYKPKYKSNEKQTTGQRICKNIKEDKNICVVDTFENLEYRRIKEKTKKSPASKKEEISFQPKEMPLGYKRPSWYRTSFSGIASLLEHSEYIPVKNRPAVEPSGGVSTGILLHSIFEDINFNASQEQISKLIDKKLKGNREFSKEGGEEKKQWIKEKVKIILNKNLQNAGLLCKVKEENKASELDFFMSSKDLKLDTIKEIMGESINNFNGNDYKINEFIANYLSGTIDLVFLGKDNKYYILDWKSNSLNDYSIEGMEKEAMIPHAYHLQYYIYTVAVKRWLEKTKNGFDFKKHFGGVFYIFIRGVNDGDDDNGIFFKSADEITDITVKLDNCFRGEANGK